MQKIKFTKMEGIGNDYVYIDATRNNIRLTPEQIQKISNRNIQWFRQDILINRGQRFYDRSI